MPGQYTAVFTFEATSMESAVTLVETWVVTPGTILQNLSGVEYAPQLPAEVPESGKVADAKEAKGSIPPVEVPPAPELPPTGAELSEEEDDGNA